MNNRLHNHTRIYSYPQSDAAERSADNALESQNVDFPTTSQIYNAVFENSFHPIYVGNGSGQIYKFNNKLCDAFGYTRPEMMWLRSGALFDINEGAYIHFLSERNTKRIAKSEVTGIRKSGERFPCRISSVIYQSDSGEKRSMNTIVDISENPSARWNLTQ